MFCTVKTLVLPTGGQRQDLGCLSPLSLVVLSWTKGLMATPPLPVSRIALRIRPDDVWEVASWSISLHGNGSSCNEVDTEHKVCSPLVRPWVSLFIVQLPEKQPLAWKGGVQVFERCDELCGSYVPKSLFSRCGKWGRMDKWSVYPVPLVSGQIC